MHAQHTGRAAQRAGDGLDLLLVGGAVGQVTQCIPGKAPAHATDHEADDQRGYRVQDGVAQQVAAYAQCHHQRRGGVRTGMPGIGDQQTGFDALGDRQHVAKQRFLGDQRDQRHPQRRHLHLGHAGRRLQLVHGRPQHADPDGQQNRAQRQRGGGFKALVAIGMVGVGLLAGLMARQQHDEVGQQVGQRMHAVGDQALRMRHQAGQDLCAAQAHVDHHADPGAARGRASVFGGDQGGIVGIFHGGQAEVGRILNYPVLP